MSSGDESTQVPENNNVKEPWELVSLEELTIGVISNL